MSESDHNSTAPDQLTADRFQPHTGSHFSVNGVPPLLLAEVRRLTIPAATPEAGPETGSAVASQVAFALEFTADHDGYLPQGTYLLQHDALGALALFLVPLGPGPGSLMRYEAIFN
jgi:hypothetical protein